jgi:hypothetical protein
MVVEVQTVEEFHNLIRDNYSATIVGKNFKIFSRL